MYPDLLEYHILFQCIFSIGIIFWYNILPNMFYVYNIQRLNEAQVLINKLKNRSICIILIWILQNRYNTIFKINQMSQNNSKDGCSARKKNIQRPSKYAKISYERRIQLINAIEKNGLTIKEAAKKIQINQSSAKFIYKCYRIQGKIFETKADKVKRQIVQQCQRQFIMEPPAPIIVPQIQPCIWPNFQPIAFSYFYNS